MYHRMNCVRTSALWLAALVGGVFLVLGGSLRAEAEGKQARPGAKLALELEGRVVAFEEADLYARVAGYVEKWQVDIGDKVKKGQVLAELDVPELKAEVQEKQARVAQARAQLETHESAVRVTEAAVALAQSRKLEAQASLMRARVLFERSKATLERLLRLENAVSKEQLAQARAQQEVDRAAVEEAEAHFKSAEAAIKKAQTEQEQAQARVKERAAGVEVARLALARAAALLSLTQIRAPFDGVAANRNVNTGDFVAPPQGAGSMPLYKIQRSDQVRVVVGLSEKELARVKVGARALVRIEALDLSLQGTVTRLAPSFDAPEKKLRVEIVLPNREGRLLSGMSARVTLSGE